MNEFFGRLVQRALAPAPTQDMVQPRLPSRFEMFERENGEAAPADAPLPTRIGAPPDQTDSLHARHATPLPTTARSTFESATSTAQRENLPFERDAANLEPIEIETRTFTVAPVTTNRMPLPEPNLTESESTEPQTQPTAQRIQPAPIQPALTLAPMLRAVGDRARDDDGQAPRPAEGLAVAPPAVERPVIQVTIGRVEVRAVSAPSHARQAPAPRQPAQSLEDYLHGRKGGAR